MRRRHASSTHTEGLGQPRGQVLVIVALGMLAMIAMAGLVTDAGLAWANRRQAQNLADAAAMAGARVIAIDRYQKVYDPAATPTFANPGTAIQTAITNAFAYDASGNQTFSAPTWGTPGSPEYTDYKARRFPNTDFPGIGPLYVVSGAIPGQAQGVWVPALATSNTLVIKVIGINSVSIGTSAAAVTGPSVPLGKLLPLVVRDRYTHCSNSSEFRTGTCDAVAVNPPIPGGPPSYQRTFQEGCVYNFRQTNPGEQSCNGSADPNMPALFGPGNFGWLDWNAGSSPDSDLVGWIDDPSTAPTAWYSAVCPNPTTSETCKVAENTLPSPKDDLFWRLDGTTGNKQSALDELATLYINKEIYVPIWRTSEDPGNGSNSTFEVIGFGVFRVDSVVRNGSNKGFTGTYVGSFRGGAIQQCTVVPSTCIGSGSAPVSFSIDLAQ